MAEEVRKAKKAAVVDDAEAQRQRKLYDAMPNPAAKQAFEDSSVALRQARIHQRSGDKVGEARAVADLRDALRRTGDAMHRSTSSEMKATNTTMQSTHDFNSDVPHPMTKKGGKP